MTVIFGDLEEFNMKEFLESMENLNQDEWKEYIEMLKNGN